MTIVDQNCVNVQKELKRVLKSRRVIPPTKQKKVDESIGLRSVVKKPSKPVIEAPVTAAEKKATEKTPEQLEKEKQSKTSLFGACLEIKTSEQNFRKGLIEGLGFIAEKDNSGQWRPKKEFTGKITADQLKPYVELSETTAFKEIDINRNSIVDFLTKQNEVIRNICEETLRNIVNDNKTRNNLINTTVGVDKFGDFRIRIINKDREKVVVDVKQELFSLPMQRTMRYKMLLEAMLKEAENFNKVFPGTIGEETINKLKETIKAAEDLSKETNDARRNYEENLLIKLRNIDAETMKFLEKQEIVIKRPISNAQIALEEIATTISDKQPEDIKSILIKYGFTKVNDKTATAIKQDYYYSLINPAIRESIREAAGDTQIHAATTLHTVRSSTKYYIEELNKAVNEKTGEINLAILQSILPKLGLEQAKIQEKCVNIEIQQKQIAELTKQLGLLQAAIETASGPNKQKEYALLKEGKEKLQKFRNGSADINIFDIEQCILNIKRTISGLAIDININPQEFKQKTSVFFGRRPEALQAIDGYLEALLKETDKNKIVSRLNVLNGAIDKALKNKEMQQPGRRKKGIEELKEKVEGLLKARNYEEIARSSRAMTSCGVGR